MRYLIQYVLLILYAVCLGFAYHGLLDAGLFNLEMYGGTLKPYRCVWFPVLVLWVAMCIPVHVQKPSGAFVWFLAILLIIPGIVCFVFSAVSVQFIVMSLVLLATQSLIAKSKSSFVFHTRYPLNPNMIAWGGVGFGVLLMLMYGNYSSIIFSFDSIYLNRALISERQFVLFEYLHPMISKSLLPFLLLCAVHRKRYSQAMVVFFISITMFFLTYHRAAFVAPFLCLSGYFLYRWFSFKFGFVLCGSFILLIVIMIGALYTGDIFFNRLSDFVIRRSLVVPSVLQSVYIDYFSEHMFTYLSDSKLTLGLLDFPYEKSGPYLIGDYIGLPGSHANAGLLGTGFQQAGIVGVAMYAVILSLFVYLVDSFSSSGWQAVSFGVTLPGYLWIICSSDLPSVFFTHGLGVSLFLVFLLKYGQCQRLDSRT